MSVTAYPDYKDSGVAWLGAVPSHWITSKVKHTYKFTTGWTPPSGSDEYYGGDNLWANISDVGARYIGDTAKRISDLAVRECNMEPSPEGSLLFSFKLSIGQMSFTTVPMFTNEAIASFMPDAAYSLPFAYYAFPIYIVANATENIYGAKMLNQELIKSAPICLPSLKEQTAIAAFLDRETAKIDALVAEQERLIALLKEKRQAVISHAVTKGLNPHVPMKDSGIEWLGEIPAHWEAVPLKHFGEFNAGAGFPHEEQGVEGEELTFYKVNALGRADLFDVLGDSEDTISRETAEKLRAFVFPPKTIAFAKIGAALLLGRLRLTDRPACFDNNMMGLTVTEGNSIDFVKHSMSLIRFDYISNPGTVPSLNEGQIANAPIARAPLEEQLEIVQRLALETARSDSLTAEAQTAIALLQERRAALISAAVTGKIDVRGLVPAELEAA